MDPFTISSIASLAGMIPSFFGGDAGDDYLQKALEQYEGIVPPDLAKAIVNAQFQQGGKLTPQQLQSLPIEAQEAVRLVENPEMRQKQEAQRQRLEQLSRTGMGPEDLLALEKVRRQTAGDAQSQLASSMTKFAQMGQGGGGASLAAALQTGQSAADRAAMEAMEVSARAQRGRTDAIKQAMDAASTMRASDLSVAEKNAENQRQKQQFDIQNAINRRDANARYAADASRYNLERQQSVQDKNIAQQNAELLRQRQAENDMFRNKMTLAGAKSGAYSNRATAERERSASQAQNVANIFGGISGVAANYGQNQNLQASMKIQQDRNKILDDRNKILGKKYGSDFDDEDQIS